MKTETKNCLATIITTMTGARNLEARDIRLLLVQITKCANKLAFNFVACADAEGPGSNRRRAAVVGNQLYLLFRVPLFWTWDLKPSILPASEFKTKLSKLYGLSVCSRLGSTIPRFQGIFLGRISFCLLCNFKKETPGQNCAYNTCIYIYIYMYIYTTLYKGIKIKLKALMPDS